MTGDDFNLATMVFFNEGGFTDLGKRANIQ